MTKKKMRACVSYYKILLGLKHWSIDITFFKSSKLYGKCDISPEYEKATLYLSTKMIKENAELKSTVIHELMHVFLSQLTHDVRDIIKGSRSKKLLRRREEALITQIERWPLWSGH